MNDYCKYKCTGGNVTVAGESYGSKTLTGGEYTLIATLPTNYRTSRESFNKGSALGGSAGILARASTDGSIYVYASIDSSYWQYNITFPL